MSQMFQLNVPEHIVERARAVADHNHRPIEDVLIDWLGQAAAEIPVSSLPDDQVLALADLKLTDEQQEEFSELLARNREGVLTDDDKARFDEIMEFYRRGMLRKAEALRVAVERGLRPRLDA